MANHQGRIEQRRNLGRRAKASRASGLRPILEGLEERQLLTVAINEFGGSAAIQMTAGITTGPDGNLWFTETGSISNLTGAVDRITPSGAIQRFTAGLSSAGVPTGITAGPNNTLWFTEYGGTAAGLGFGASAIGRIDAATGTITEFKNGLTANSGPSQITLGSDGALWFTENVGNQIGRIDPATGTITEFSTGLSANSQPVGIVSAPDGALWFAESNTDLIGRIDPITKQITEFGAGVISPNSAPTGIAVGPDGNLWFTEFGSSSNPAGGLGRITLLGAITQFSTGLTPNSQPSGIASTGPNGSLFFTERGTGFIGQITTQGTITEFTQNPATQSPAVITLGPDNNLWFTELTGTHVDRITPAGALTSFPRADALPSGATPTGIAPGSDGALWFTEPGINAIGRIDTSSNITQFTTGINGSPQRITQGPGNTLWFTETGGKIGRITTDGTVTEFTDPITPLQAPNYITLGPDGNLWFTEGNGVGTITPTGTITQFFAGIASGGTTVGITTGSDRNLWFTVDRGGQGVSSVDRITTAGVVTEFSISTPNPGPADITSGPGGALYFTESLVGTLSMITTSGQITDLATIPNSSPTGVVNGPDNFIYFLESGLNAVGRFDGSGPSLAVTQLPIPTGFSSPLTIAVGPDANLWFTESSANQVGQVVLPQTSVKGTASGPVTLAAGQPLNQLLVTFNDNSAAVSAANFAATIDYGDGTPLVQAVITPQGGGVFTINGTHLYSNPGQYTILVTIFNAAGRFGVPQPTVVTVTQPMIGNFLVINNNDSGPGSLRQAIQGANRSTSSTITFAIPSSFGDPASGIVTINPSTPLPRLVKPTFVDGTTEATFLGRPASTILVQLSGSRSPGSAGLAFDPGSDGSVVKGLSIFGFLGPQVEFDSDDDRVSGSYLGFSSLSVFAAAGGSTTVGAEGVLVTGSGAVIGGLTTADRNVISGNADHGILFAGPLAVGGRVLGNFIGTNPAGNAPLPNFGNGIVAVGGAEGLIIRQNLISGNDGNGVELSSSTGNVISSNLIGTDSLGGDPVPNLGTGVCVDVGSTNNTIGGLVSDGSTNIISANKLAGVAIQGGSSGNLVLGNRIGTNCVGNFARGNGAAGILVRASDNNLFKFNLISGNIGNGLELFQSAGNLISSNLIGTDSLGGDPVPNTGSGVCVDVGSDRNTVGGLVSEGGTNIISANGIAGVAIQGGSSSNRVLGNRVGTNCVGNFARGNGDVGILVKDSSGNLIGPDNLVSGNGRVRDGAGIWIDGETSAGNSVFGNKVGTDLAGESAIPNAIVGIIINLGHNNVIGGPLPADCNLVSGNTSIGVEIAGESAVANAVQSNVIGLDTAGTRALGNGGSSSGVGLFILNAPHNFIGGSTLALGNLISGNSFDGVELFGAGAHDNLLQSNRIGLNGSGNGAIGNGNDGLVFDGAGSNRVVLNFISGNGRNGVFVSGSNGVELITNFIGVGLGNEPEGNQGYGILVGNGSNGPADPGTNLDLYNARGPYRNLDAVPSIIPAPTVIVTQGSRQSASRKALTIQPKAQSFGSRPVAATSSRIKAKAKA